METMPGTARTSASTTRRSEGITEIRRSTRSTRSARSTAKPSAPGIRATPITRKSNTFHALRKNPRHSAYSLSAISIRKMPRQILSSTCSSPPNDSVTAGEVSNPRITALTRMTTMMKVCTGDESTKRPTAARECQASARSTESFHAVRRTREEARHLRGDGLLSSRVITRTSPRRQAPRWCLRRREPPRREPPRRPRRSPRREPPRPASPPGGRQRPSWSTSPSA